MLARYVGWAMLGLIVIGLLTAFTVAQGIDINLTAEVRVTAENMLQSEQNLRAKAYIGGLMFILEMLVAIGLFVLLCRQEKAMAALSLSLASAAALLTLLGAVFALNAAEFAGDAAYRNIADGQQRLMLAGLQATSDYTSFHLALILGSLAKAGYYLLFLRSALIPKIIAGWGLFASLFVAFTIVARDFWPLLGHGGVTAAFMLSNLIALLSTGIYLAWFGIRQQ